MRTQKIIPRHRRALPHPAPTSPNALGAQPAVKRWDAHPEIRDSLLLFQARHAAGAGGGSCRATFRAASGEPARPVDRGAEMTCCSPTKTLVQNVNSIRSGLPLALRFAVAAAPPLHSCMGSHGIRHAQPRSSAPGNGPGLVKLATENRSRRASVAHKQHRWRGRCSLTQGPFICPCVLVNWWRTNTLCGSRLLLAVNMEGDYSGDEGSYSKYGGGLSAYYRCCFRPS